ncbi:MULTISPECIES: hypothetical protein [unclassified Acidovorax]|uniref:hypothetical protein n=1 Tax=unclassified Acidovorax TaxID=2684926 RepID=UPI00288351F3|nr:MULTISPECIES: hypothetical protein [unclassified Acidovorax]
MQALRTSSLLARLVLAWFMLTVGTAIASPIVHPQAMQLVCATGSTVKLVVVGEDGNAVEMGHQTLDCAMCLGAGAPPPQESIHAAYSEPLAHALKPVVAANIAALVGAPLPARGPPALL